MSPQQRLTERAEKVTSDSQGNGGVSRGNLTWISSGLRILVLLTAAPAYGSSNFLTLIKDSHLVIRGDLFDLEKDRPSGFCWMCILHAAPFRKPDVTRLLPTLEMR
ncbi:hypothetical protein EAF00_010574 [Botryotinia globosa]|nr:hypothetical protein EAF00_010574 [Botryotinia globosa]